MKIAKKPCKGSGQKASNKLSDKRAQCAFCRSPVELNWQGKIIDHDRLVRASSA